MDQQCVSHLLEDKEEVCWCHEFLQELEAAPLGTTLEITCKHQKIQNVLPPPNLTVNVACLVISQIHRNGDVLCDKYVVQDLLGSGGNGTTFKVTNARLNVDHECSAHGCLMIRL